MKTLSSFLKNVKDRGNIMPIEWGKRLNLVSHIYLF